jgi:hypothetical protein
VPVFDELPYQESLKLPFLNGAGHSALSRILWCIRKQHSELEYNPLVAKTGALLLVFLTEAEAYAVLEHMVSSSIEILRDEGSGQWLRWHFTMTQTQFSQLGAAFLDSTQKLSNTFRLIYGHLQSIKYDFNGLFESLVSSLFLGFLPFRVVFRIWVIFLNEGVKALFRMVFALLRVQAKSILENSTESTMTELIRKLSINMDEATADAFIKKAFSLHFERLDQILGGYSAGQQKVRSVTAYYFPSMSHNSGIIESSHLELIWNWLPGAYKILNPELVWSTALHGYNLAGMLRKAEEKADYPSLLVLKARDDSILGAFSDEMPRLGPAFTGSNETFIFRADSRQARAFRASNLNDQFLGCSEKALVYGQGGEGPGLVIEDNLRRAQSHRCETFSSERLAEGRLEVGGLELYCLR